MGKKKWKREGKGKKYEEEGKGMGEREREKKTIYYFSGTCKVVNLPLAIQQKVVTTNSV